MILVGYIDNIGSKSFVGQENCEKIIKERVCGLLIFIFMLENGLKGRPPLPIQSPGPSHWEVCYAARFCLFSSICLVWIESNSMSFVELVRFP